MMNNIKWQKLQMFNGRGSALVAPNGVELARIESESGVSWSIYLAGTDGRAYTFIGDELAAKNYAIAMSREAIEQADELIDR